MEETSGNIHWQYDKEKLEHNKWTGRWKVYRASQRGLSPEVVAEGIQIRCRRV